MSGREPSPSGSNRSRSSSRSGSAASRSRSGSPASKRSGSGSRGSSPAARSARSSSGGSRSGGSRSGGSRSGGSRSRSGSSRGSVMSEDEAPTERKDIEDSGSDKDDEPMQIDERKSPETERRMSVGSGGGGGDDGATRKNASGSDDDDGAAARKNASGSDDDDGPAARKNASGSDDNDGADARKKSSGSDDDDKMDTADVGAEDIFGDNLSISSDDDDAVEATNKKVTKTLESDDDSERDVQRYDDDEEDKDNQEKSPKIDAEPEKEPQEEQVQVPETRIDVEVPKITTDLGKELYFVKLPNFLSVECRPFEAENYEDEIEDEDSLDEEGRQRLKLKVENTIRWKQEFDSEGKAVKQSNARLVRWSDGSTSLYLGSEIFDVHKQSLHGDFNHMFIRQGTGLQGQAIFRTKLSFRPHSTDSKTHQKMTRQMADRSHKATGIKVISQVGRDPEANRYKRVKEEEERLRADLRRNSKVNRIREKATSRGLTKGYLEGNDSDEEGVSLSAIKNRFKKGRKQGYQTYSSDEEDSDVETHKAKKLEKAKGFIDDSDEESGQSKKSSRASSRKSSPTARSKSGSRSPSRSRSKSRSVSRSRSSSRSRSAASGSPKGSESD